MAIRAVRRMSFLAGMARVFDPGAAVRRGRRARSAAEADMLAMRSDWEAVGGDIRKALEMQRAQMDEAQVRALSDAWLRILRQAPEAQRERPGGARTGGGGAGQP